MSKIYTLSNTQGKKSLPEGVYHLTTHIQRKTFSTRYKNVHEFSVLNVYITGNFYYIPYIGICLGKQSWAQLLKRLFKVVGT